MCSCLPAGAMQGLRGRSESGLARRRQARLRVKVKVRLAGAGGLQVEANGVVREVQIERAMDEIVRYCLFATVLFEVFRV